MKDQFSHLLDGLSEAELRAEAKRLEGVLADRQAKLKDAKTEGQVTHLTAVIAQREEKLAAVKTRLGVEPAPEASDLDKLTVAQLKERCEARSLDISGCKVKADYVALLKA